MPIRTEYASFSVESEDKYFTSTEPYYVFKHLQAVQAKGYDIHEIFVDGLKIGNDDFGKIMQHLDEANATAAIDLLEQVSFEVMSYPIDSVGDRAVALISHDLDESRGEWAIGVKVFHEGGYDHAGHCATASSKEARRYIEEQTRIWRRRGYRVEIESGRVSPI